MTQAATAALPSQLATTRASLALSEVEWLLSNLAHRFPAVAWTPAGLADLVEHLDEVSDRVAHLQLLAAAHRDGLAQ